MTTTGLLALFIQYRYAVFIPLALLEGTVVSLLAGVMCALGYFNPITALVVLIISDIIPDTVWYFAGHHAHRRDLINRFGHHVGMTPARLQFVVDLWHRRPTSTLILSKLAYGMAAPMLMSAGYARMPVSQYYGIIIPFSAVHYATLMILGASMYRSYLSVLPYVRHVELLAAFAIILILIAAWKTSSAARKRLFGQS